MYILGISGSPRKDGNTDLFLKEILNSVGCEHNFIALRDLEINLCDGCSTCKTRHSCHIQDDMTLVYEEFKRAGVIIFASPVYFGNISGQLKKMMDRTLCFYHNKQLEHKIGAALVTMGKDGGDLALQAIDRFCQYHHIIYAGGVYGMGGRKKGVIMQDEEAIEDARKLGKRIVKLHKLTRRLDE